MAILTPTFRAVGAAVFTSNNVATPTALSPVKHASTVNGDLMILVTTCRGRLAQTASTPNGWTLATGFPKKSGTTSGGQIFVFYRIATGAADDNPTTTWSNLGTGTTGDSCTAQILSYSNTRAVQDGTPPTENDAASTTSITIPAHTTAVDKSLVIGIAMRVNDTAHTFTTATFTERSDIHTTTGGGHGVTVSELIKTPAGNSGTATVTPSNTTSSRTLAVSLGLRAAESWDGTDASVSGAGTIEATGVKTVYGTGASVSGVATITASGTVEEGEAEDHFGTDASVTGTGTISATGVVTKVGTSASVAGSGAINGGTGTVNHLGSAASVTGNGTITATGLRSTFGTSAAISGTGTISAAGTRATFGTSASVAGTGSISATGVRSTFGTSGAVAASSLLVGAGTVTHHGTNAAVLGVATITATGIIEGQAGEWFGTDAAVTGSSLIQAVGVVTHLGTSAVVTGNASINAAGYIGEQTFPNVVTHSSTSDRIATSLRQDRTANVSGFPLRNVVSVTSASDRDN